MNNKCKQVKEVGINPDFEAAQAGNPLCHACGAEEGKKPRGRPVKKPRGRPVKIGVEKHIRITDVSMTEMINALVNHPDGGNFNQVINEALFYGLPILYEKLYGGTVTEEEKISLVKPRKKGSKYEELNAVTVQLLRETVLNATINKSILSSIFNFICEKCSDERDIIKEFNTGLLADTPEYLVSFEAEGIKKLRR